ncbi:MAG: cyclic nucleotide-binding domain-containing protein [Spirulina sp. SIO3F2]|nr:cyclic nucleotide-binding domain-containing protein [Spirulina sp. SIO3F2]
MRQIAHWVQQRWQQPFGRKLIWVMLLGLLLSALCMMGLVLGSALLLTQVGPQGLPWVYVSLGVVSLPLYVGLAQIVDRISRPRLLQSSLIGAIAALGLALVSIELWPDQPSIYIAIDVGLYSLWILLLEVLFPSWVTDYFTALDWQRCSTAIRIAIALGGLMGGGGVAILARWWAPSQLLWGVVLMAVGAIALVTDLARRLEPLPATATSTPEPQPFTRAALAAYPIIPLLAASTFLTVVLYCLGEYLYLGVYAQTIADAATLTQFLGQIRMLNNAIPLVVLYSITQPLLHRFGVVVMNLVYPLTTLGVFMGLGISPTLMTALVANLNNDGLEDSLNQPIAILNYNAVPYAWVGRVRALCHGLMYSLGLMLAGGTLALLQHHFTRTQVVAVGLGASLLFLGLRYGMSRSYLRSLLRLLQAQRLDWEQVRRSVPQLPQQYHLQVDDLLQSGDRQDQLLGVTLAARLEQPQTLLPDLITIGETATPDSALARRLRRLFREHPHPAVGQALIQMLSTTTRQQQQLALEALIRRNDPIPRSVLEPLLSSIDPTVRGLSYLAAQRLDWRAVQDSTVCEELPVESRLAVLQVIRATGDRRLISLVQRLIEDQTLEVLRAGLDTLAVLTDPGERSVSALAQRELSTFDPLIRALNMQLLGQLQSPQFLLDVAVGLEHRQLSVRLWAAQALAQYGNKSLRFAKTYLHAQRPEVVRAAIAALGRVKSKAAIELLFNFLTPDYRRLKQLHLWQQVLPQSHPDEVRLHQIMADAQARIFERVWAVLKALEGNSSLLRDLEPFLHTGDARLRASAIERLASGRWRRFVLPLLPLLTQDLQPEAERHPPELTPKPPTTAELIRQLWRSDDRWLRLGALLWLSNHGQPIPEALCTDANPLVERVAIALRVGDQEDLPENDWFLKQLFFLKQSTPLGSLTLDELEVINPLLNQRDFRQGEVICAPQRYRPQIYIICQGQVALSPLGLTLGSGEVFGVLTLWETATWQQTVTAQTDCCVLTLSELHCKDLIDRCPRILWCLAGLRDRMDCYRLATPLQTTLIS